MSDIIDIIALETGFPKKSIPAVIQLLEAGNTVPFIARYRKEITGNLDEVAIRTIQERLTYLRELAQRREVILASIAEQGKLTAELRKQIDTCATRTELEDLYLPFRPRRRTRATVAREKGLEPLADAILKQHRQGKPDELARQFVDENKGVVSAEDALAGARDIVAEHLSEMAIARAYLRRLLKKEGDVVAKVTAKHKEEKTKFEQYYDYREKAIKIPSHRYLAVRRGENEDILKVRLDLDTEKVWPRLFKMMRLEPSSPFASQLKEAVEDGYQRLLFPSVEKEVLADLKDSADRDAVEIFARNLRHLLLAPPLGQKAVIGVDPGLRTGCKCVAVDNTGKFLEHVTFYLTKDEKKEAQIWNDFVKKYHVLAIGVGNGTGGREAEQFIRKQRSEAVVVPVNEAGASIYSASDIARQEFPNLDLTIRGAISIARRLQDPLAELVKIDPKSIGVGQYQHDVHQTLLQQKLGEVVESCVNYVGVELNTSSSALLSYVAGIGPSLADKIIAHREAQGPFLERKALLKVKGFGPKAFEQAAGFLRIREGKQPLDASAVHPERYPLVEKMAHDVNVSVENIVGNPILVDKIDISRYISSEVGKLTLTDILQELKKPGRDPRKRFEPPRFREDVSSIEDLKTGMSFEGVVTNVTAFGAFVDIGVHQDGLVHISQLADRFVRDPNEVVTVGEKLKVQVLEVDIDRRRISLSARQNMLETKGGNG